GSSFLIGIILATGFSLAGALELVRARFRSREAGDVQVDETGGSESDVEVVTEEPKAVYETQTLDDLPAAREKEAEAIISESRTVAGAYQRPPLKLLIKSPQSHDLSSKKGVKESVGILKRTLQHFEVAADVKRVVQGPTVTRFEVELSPGVKVNRILNLADDIALALASPDVRILAPIPGKSAVGIEVPNKYRQMVTLGDILRSKQSREATKPLTFGLGKDIGNQPVLASMTDMPHLLIAGATGAGKSVCINSIITSILVKADPADVKMILVDPKRVEFNTYNDIPHLLTPVVTDPKKASVVLAWAVEEMERRYKILAKNKARNIAAYEELASKGEEGEFEKIPFILIIIDELADLMMVSASDVEDGISRLAQMARAVGIHLIVATQRPSADIITGIIRSNITSRIAFTVSSQTDSRVIMDMGGAERLVGKGDMLFLSSGALRPKRVQGSFLTEQEISHVTEFIKKQAKPEYDMDILEKGAKGLSLAVTEDDLLDDAMDLVVNAGYASVSLIQRRLRVGYTRAARLIDIMEDKGIVGGYEGSKPREVLIDADQLQRIRESDLDEQGTVQH
ncbi:MAG: DNA translocase FtsK, partial [Terriglobia bacterium]